MRRHSAALLALLLTAPALLGDPPATAQPAAETGEVSLPGILAPVRVRRDALELTRASIPPWSPVDSLVIGKGLAFSLSHPWLYRPGEVAAGTRTIEILDPVP